MNTKIMKLSAIKQNPNNPRSINKDKFAKLVKSIEEFPRMLELRPIVLNKDNIVLGGNMRLKACKQIGLSEVPVVYADDLTEEEQRQFIIKDNVGFGDWDWELLANEWDVSDLNDWGLDLPDMDVQVLEAEEDNYEEPDNLQVDVVLGDLIEIGEHRLLCGDSTDSDQVARLMNGEKADMVFTDPPYGVNYIGGTKKRNNLIGDERETTIYEDVIPIISNIVDGPCYVWYADKNPNGLYEAVKKYGEIHSVIIWNKNNSTFNMNIHYKAKHEPCLYWKPKNKTLNWSGGNNQETVWDIDRESANKYHPTQKPIAVPYRAIQNHKAPIVADLFLGSGSTMVAAHQLNRKCYGMELDPKYCQVIIDRMLNLDPTLEVKINGKRYDKK